MKSARKAHKAADSGEATSGLPSIAEAPTGFPGAPEGVVDFAVADTTPGAGCVLAPAEGYRPSSEAYRAGLRHLWRTNPAARQHLAILAGRIEASYAAEAVPVVGPYAAEAAEILAAIKSRN